MFKIYFKEPLKNAYQVSEEEAKDYYLINCNKEGKNAQQNCLNYQIQEKVKEKLHIEKLEKELELVLKLFKEMIKEIKRNHYSKVPIYSGNQDNIVGILFATDLIGLTEKEIADSRSTLNKILRKPYFIPETKKAESLFQAFRKRKISIAVVLDEYGGVVGLVTMEDLLEEIFGEISDEFEKEERKCEKIDQNTYRVHSTMTLEEFNRIFGTDLYSDEVDTIGGFVFSLFGELPTVNSVVRYENLTFKVEKVLNNRIEVLLVMKKG